MQPPISAPQITSITLSSWRQNPAPVYVAQGTLMGVHAFVLGAEPGLVYLGLITPELSLEAQLARWQNKHQSPVIQDETPFDFAHWINRTWVLIGSEFQCRVWRALLNIPEGQVTSYKTLATAVNSPRGYQAVGQAVGANPLSVLVPCHRVICQNGDLGGYHWGLPLKKQLLVQEGAMTVGGGEKLVPRS
jgi:AraC family transcriptional regulator of adaptative response/methylated-DNA-[protein]-cysteine methyltransferase